jgi:hypothetical protein
MSWWSVARTEPTLDHGLFVGGVCKVANGPDQRIIEVPQREGKNLSQWSVRGGSVA